MTENELYELNGLSEIDPDYEPKRVEAVQNENARITTKKAWFLSLLLPILSILASAVLIIWNLIFIKDGYSFYFIFVTLLGLIIGGIVPTVLIVKNRLDTSKYFLGKLFILVTASILTVTFALKTNINGFVMLGLILAAELIYAAVQKTDVKTKVCLFLSSLAWSVLGFFLDLWLAFTFFWSLSAVGKP